MGDKKPTYEELEARLAEAESTRKAIYGEKVDAFIGKSGVYLLRLKEVEEALKTERMRLESVLRQLPQGVLIAEAPSGKLVTANAQFERIWRHKFVSLESIAEYKSYKGFHLDGKPYLPQEWPLARTIAKGEIVDNEEIRFQRSDGSSGWLSVSSAPIIDDKGDLVAGVVTFSDVTDRKQAEETLRQLNETLEQQVAERTELANSRAKQLQALAVELIQAEEHERQRIAKLLHDDLQQLLASARMQLQWTSERLPSEPMLAQVVKLLEEATEKTRSLSHELSPSVVQHADLVAALKWLSANMLKQFGLHVQLKSESVCNVESLPAKMFLFRSAQELLFNVVKHAGVKRAQVVCSGSENAVSLKICDEGKGFNPAILDSGKAAAGLGLRSLRERVNHIGGSLIIESTPGQGSRFTLTVPLDSQKTGELLQFESGKEPMSP